VFGGTRMKWPEKPTIHKNERHLPGMEADLWVPERVPEPEASIIVGRSCSYCGSIHPEDALKALEAAGRVEMADWKYGYPHKAYIHEVPVEGQPDTKYVRPKPGAKPGSGDAGFEKYEAGPGWAKFYTRHLLDEGFDDEAFDALAGLLVQHTRVLFARDDKGLSYRKLPKPKPEDVN
jgi:hypothetical protein